MDRLVSRELQNVHKDFTVSGGVYYRDSWENIYFENLRYLQAMKKWKWKGEYWPDLLNSKGLF